MKKVFLITALVSSVYAKHDIKVGVIIENKSLNGKINNYDPNFPSQHFSGTNSWNGGFSCGYNYKVHSLLLGLETRLIVNQGKNATLFDYHGAYSIKANQSSLSGEMLAKIGTFIGENQAVYAGVGAKTTRVRYNVDLEGGSVDSSKTSEWASPLLEIGFQGEFKKSPLGWSMSFGYSPHNQINIPSPLKSSQNLNVKSPFQVRMSEYMVKFGLTYKL